ncbi:hypothetical protein ACFW2Y_08495 [Streptomyces sp. NPDC058877]|uniref:hypothetical protein n=1 Tax=unclassified Streptomyces TaxID=2593676 RepID=UPI0036AF98C0
MDLRTRIRRTALARPTVLLVPSPGGTRVRLAVERELARRGWPQSTGPADADLLVFAGDPLPLGRDDWAERVWRSVPAPKARVTVGSAGETARLLDRGHAMLLEPPARHAGHTGADGQGRPGEHGHEGRDDGRFRGAKGGAGGAQDHDRGHGNGPREEGHGSHTGHEGHSSSVAGLPMAERADDRDGLRLDRLHVPLGPALPDWPAGLVLRVALQGDLVQRASVETVHVPPSAPRRAFWNEPWLRALEGEQVTTGEAARRRCAAHLDSLGRLLGVAGWDDAAARARGARDQVLGGAPQDVLAPRIVPLVRRLRRSWTLRWLTAGVGAGNRGPVDGDVHGRLLGWLDAIERALGEIAVRAPLLDGPPTGPRGRVDAGTPASQVLLDALPGLLEGAEFACARLIVASLDPDLDELPPEHPPGGHGRG